MPLTYAAIVAYKAANPDANISYSLTNNVTGAYEMTVVNVERNITGYSLLKASEQGDKLNEALFSKRSKGWYANPVREVFRVV